MSRYGKPLQCSKLWEAIAQWRSAGQVSHPEDWPLASGVAGEEAVKSWRDRAAQGARRESFTPVRRALDAGVEVIDERFF